MIKGLAERLQSERTKNNLSQKEVAKFIGVSPSIISNYEKGERTPSLENLTSLAKLFHCSSDYLLGIGKNDNSILDVSMLTERQITLLKQFLFEIK